jgi:predicted flap endonuclease-1-like 5' DNA nuclease
MELPDAIQYIIAQVAGAIVAALLLLIIANGTADYSVAENGLGQNGWGKGYLGEYGILSAFLFEVVATFLFVVVILGATGSNAPAAIAGLAIGLTLVVIHLVGINITGVSVNPARSVGPALFSGWWSLAQLPLFIIAPVLGAIGAGLLFGSGMLNDPSGDERSTAAPDTSTVDQSASASDADSGQNLTTHPPQAAATAVTPTFAVEASKPEGLSGPRGGVADDLKEITGVGPAMETLLNGLGCFHFDQVAAWTPAEVAWVDDNLEGFKGRVTRDDWVSQAKALAAKS